MNLDSAWIYAFIASSLLLLVWFIARRIYLGLKPTTILYSEYQILYSKYRGLHDELTQLKELQRAVLSGPYWGLLGSYRDLTRQLQYLAKKNPRTRPECLEDLEIAKQNIERVLETAALSLSGHHLSDHPKTMLNVAHRQGLKCWAAQQVREGF